MEHKFLCDVWLLLQGNVILHGDSCAELLSLFSLFQQWWVRIPFWRLVIRAVVTLLPRFLICTSQLFKDSYILSYSLWSSFEPAHKGTRLWYLPNRRPVKAQASLRICAVSPEPSLFAHMKYESRRKVRPKIRHLAPLDGCACAFKEWVYGGQKVP